MGQVIHKFDLIEGGCFDLVDSISKHPAKHLQNTQDKWVTSSELERLSGISQQNVNKAIRKKVWRGADLLVREEITGRGRGGKTLLVHVDSLPGDLREAWYLERGIVLHEKPDTETGETLLIPEQTYQNDARFEADLELARWRHEIIRPVLTLEKQSADRAALIADLAAVPHLFPNGSRKQVTKQTLYNWVNAFEAEGLNGLIRKRRNDTGAKRQQVTRAWDKFFAAQIDATAQAKVSDELTTYIRSLWASGDHPWKGG